MRIRFPASCQSACITALFLKHLDQSCNLIGDLRKYRMIIVIDFMRMHIHVASPVKPLRGLTQFQRIISEKLSELIHIIFLITGDVIADLDQLIILSLQITVEGDWALERWNVK